jgi:hypothetical protein
MHERHEGLLASHIPVRSRDNARGKIDALAISGIGPCTRDLRELPLSTRYAVVRHSTLHEYNDDDDEDE